MSSAKYSNFGVPYNYRSVMHYSEKAFSENGKPTIVPKFPSSNQFPDGKMGQRNGFATSDIEKIRRMYSCVGQEILNVENDIIRADILVPTPLPQQRFTANNNIELSNENNTTSIECIVHCMFKRNEWMDDDGEFSLMKTEKALRDYFGQKPNYNVLRYCANIPSKDKCERAFSFGICLLRDIFKFEVSKQLNFYLKQLNRLSQFQNLLSKFMLIQNKIATAMSKTLIML